MSYFRNHILISPSQQYMRKDKCYYHIFIVIVIVIYFQIKVSVKTDEVSCTFSSTSGCYLTKNNLLTSINKSTQKNKTKKKSLTSENHSDARTGIQSVMTQINDILSGVKIQE